MTENEIIILNKEKDNQEETREKQLKDKLLYYTILYKFPKYLEKVNIIINQFILYFSVFFIQI